MLNLLKVFGIQKYFATIVCGMSQSAWEEEEALPVIKLLLAPHLPFQALFCCWYSAKHIATLSVGPCWSLPIWVWGRRMRQEKKAWGRKRDRRNNLHQCNNPGGSKQFLPIGTAVSSLQFSQYLHRTSLIILPLEMPTLAELSRSSALMSLLN